MNLQCAGNDVESMGLFPVAFAQQKGLTMASLA
jgi:hypothetical protein